MRLLQRPQRTDGEHGSDEVPDAQIDIAAIVRDAQHFLRECEAVPRLREKARTELGNKFDIRAFHDEVLGAGALPMDVFERRINKWIERSKSGEIKKAE